MRLLIIGVTAFLGRATAVEALRRGDTVTYLLDSIVARRSGTYNVSAPPGNTTSWGASVATAPAV